MDEDKLILSAKEILKEKQEISRKKKLSDVQIGQVLHGTVATLKDYGAFIDLGDGLSGLVHISQISNKYIKHPSEVLSVGDTVKVKILSVDSAKKRIALTMKF